MTRRPKARATPSPTWMNTFTQSLKMLSTPKNRIVRGTLVIGRGVVLVDQVHARGIKLYRKGLSAWSAAVAIDGLADQALAECTVSQQLLN